MREKTVTISFRISQSAFDALREDAKRHSTSLNTLANQLFMSYAEHDRFLQKFVMIKISAPTFKRVLNAAPRDEIVEAGRRAGGSIPEGFILAKMGEISTASAVQYLRLMGTYANLFDYSELGSQGKASLTLAHDLGPNGSAFLGSYVKSLFEQCGNNAKVTELENAVRIELSQGHGGARGTSSGSLQLNAGDTSP